MASTVRSIDASGRDEFPEATGQRVNPMTFATLMDQVIVLRRENEELRKLLAEINEGLTEVAMRFSKLRVS